jgi:hypothetical protein
MENDEGDLQKTRAVVGVRKSVSNRRNKPMKGILFRTLTLLLLVTAELEVLATLEGHLHLVLADGALETEDNLLGRLGLLVENGLGLSSVTCEFSRFSSVHCSSCASCAASTKGRSAGGSERRGNETEGERKGEGGRRRTGLLPVVTTLSLSEERGLARLVLGHLVRGVLAALLTLAVGPAGLGDVDHLKSRELSEGVAMRWDLRKGGRRERAMGEKERGVVRKCTK